MMVSYVIPCYRSAATIAAVVGEIRDAMESRPGYSYEIILVNDGSPDDTLAAIRSICLKDTHVTGIDLARNFGQHAALMAGMSRAAGDVVVCLDDDGQTPAGEAWKLLDKIEEDCDVVYAKYDHKMHSGFRNLGSRMNGLMAEKLLGKPKDLYVSSFFAAKRFVIDEILQYRNPFPYVIGLVLQTTNKIGNADITHRQRTSGRSGYTFRKLLGLWVNGFTAFSVKPLRLSAILGVLSALAGLILAIFAVVNEILHLVIPLCQYLILAAILLIGGATLTALGLIGEYIGRIYLSLNQLPQYVIREVIRDGSNNV